MHRVIIDIPLSVYKIGVLFLLVALGFLGVLYVREYAAHRVAQEEAHILVQALESTTVRLDDAEHRLGGMTEQLEVHKQLLADARREVQRTGTTMTALEAAVASVSETATYLTKLKETDEELLAKYSKVYFLNEHYVPKKLSPLSAEITQGKDMQFHTQALPFIEALVDEAHAQGLSPFVVSAYRSFDYQGALKGRYTQVYGSGANTFSADQGYSEHQLGTAVDFSTAALAGGLVGFEKTPEYTWLVHNAHRFGFTLSYPENNAFYQFEPWHWRFVGVSLATYLYEHQMHFYDMPQRDIDAYRTTIFD